MSKALTFDFNNMMSGAVGKDGITDGEINGCAAKAAEARAAVLAEAGKGWQGWMNLPYNQDEIVKDILECAVSVRSRCDAFVVLGIGGSALGPSAVFNALKHLRYNDLPKEKRGGPKFYVKDTAAGFMAIADCDAAIGRELNIATGVEHSIGDLARELIAQINPQATIVCEAERLRPEKSEVNRLLGDATQLRTLTGWAPQYTFAQGLAETIEFLRGHLDSYKVGQYIL